jgi:hypothetical protein
MALVALRQETAKVSIPLVRRDMDEHVIERGSFLRVDGHFAAHHETHPDLVRRLERADHPVEAVAIGDADGIVPELRRTLDEGTRRRASPEK